MPRSTDALALLEADHHTVRELFAKYDGLGDRAMVGRQDLVRRISTELAVHVHIEEQIFYPRVRAVGREIKDEVLEGLEEHHVIKRALAELAGMAPEDERFDAKVQVLKENVEHHVEEEESEMFPRVRKALSSEELRQLATALEAAKATAPHEVDPGAPDEPSAIGPGTARV